MVGLTDLVDKIENNMFNLESIDFDHSLKKYSCGSFFNSKSYYHTVILGCTHYNFIKNKIFDHFRPLEVLDGTTYLIINLERFLKNKKSLVKYKRFSIFFIGKNAKQNEKFFLKNFQKNQN